MQAEIATGGTMTARAPDPKLQALEDLRAALKPRLVPGLTVSRDNPGRTPPAWSVRELGGRAVVTFGLIDRTFFWTFDEGDSNHYIKDEAAMARIIADELRRSQHMV